MYNVNNVGLSTQTSHNAYIEEYSETKIIILILVKSYILLQHIILSRALP